MQEVRLKRILSIQEKVQIRSWFTRVEKKLPGQLKVQNQVMRSVCDRGKLHVRRQVQFYSQGKVLIRGDRF